MDTDVLARLIDNKHALLVQLLELAQRQAIFVEQGDMTRMMSLLAMKQRLLNAIEQLERQLDPFREQDPDARVWRSPDDRARARETSTACDALLRQIMAVEKQCEGGMSLRRDEAAERLQAAHFSSQAAHAYASLPGAAGGQFDISCES